jgi:hypothetical protein
MWHFDSGPVVLSASSLPLFVAHWLYKKTLAGFSGSACDCREQSLQETSPKEYIVLVPHIPYRKRARRA